MRRIQRRSDRTCEKFERNSSIRDYSRLVALLLSATLLDSLVATLVQFPSSNTVRRFTPFSLPLFPVSSLLCHDPRGTLSNATRSRRDPIARRPIDGRTLRKSARKLLGGARVHDHSFLFFFSFILLFLLKFSFLLYIRNQRGGRGARGKGRGE
ncbi:unnamed protein product [Xylocopa violacea]|uniref:Transmembrane protein n=1 Tax=Xylocopa violacea TaxID=135666 RepID=A0ABP1P798_XYLVO